MSGENKTCIQEMLSALDANINFLRENGSSQIIIRNGQFINDVGEVFIYEFTLDFFQDIELDTDIEVRVKNRNASGKVIALDDKKIQVELDRNIGTTVPEARLVISSYYLLQLLYDKLKGVEDGEIKFTDLAEKAFNIKQSQISLDKDYKVPFSSVSNKPNKYQDEAIRVALGSEVSFIWGPPGTGKTETIARIIEGFITKSMSVLLLSHTNMATDGALFHFVKHLFDSDDYREGKFVRIGDIKKQELRKKYELVIPEVILEKKSIPIKNEIDSLTRQIDDISLSIKEAEKIIENYDRLKEVINESSDLETEIISTQQKLELLDSHLFNIKSSLAKVNNDINQYQSKGAIGRFFSGLNLEKLSAEKAKTLIMIEEYNNQIISHRKILDYANTRMLNLDNEKVAIENEIKGENENKYRQIVNEGHKKISDLEEQINFLSKQLEDLAANLIKEAKVIATTLTKSYSSKLVLEREYDCVIVDEASMAPLPALWCATGLAKKKVVIVGDFYQLPPILKHRVSTENKTQEEVKREEELVKKWLSKDIFENSGICSAIERGESPEWLRQLKIQYRMHPDIADVINQLIYSKGSKDFVLENGENTFKNGVEFLDKEPLKKAHIGIYDTSTIGTVANRTDSRSYYNFYNAFLAVELAKQALLSGYKSIGIICPFRPQANLIQKILIDCKIDDKVNADTVHKFQGDEKRIIIFDTTTANPTKLTDDQEKGGDDEKLINVAFSRAQDKCIVIADIQNILKKHSETSLFKKFVNYCLEKDATIKSSENILSHYSVSDKSEKWLEKIYNIKDLTKQIENSKLFSEADFYQNFVKDLLTAKKEVIIDSPYITSERMRIMMPVFEHLRNKDINIFVLTRQTKEHSTSMKYQAEGVIEDLEKLGIVVLPFFGRIHRKLAIIDRKILWEGSLNILSQRDSKEVMRRLEGEETAKQMISFLRLDKNIGKIGENKLKKCEKCNSWFWTDKGQFGIWTFCLAGSHKPGAKPVSKEEKAKKKKELEKLKHSKKKMTKEGVPICNNPKREPVAMVRKKGPFGEFWGCPKYPKCKVTEKIAS